MGGDVGTSDDMDGDGGDKVEGAEEGNGDAETRDGNVLSSNERIS